MKEDRQREKRREVLNRDGGSAKWTDTERLFQVAPETVVGQTVMPRVAKLHLGTAKSMVLSRERRREIQGQ